MVGPDRIEANDPLATERVFRLRQDVRGVRLGGAGLSCLRGGDSRSLCRGDSRRGLCGG